MWSFIRVLAFFVALAAVSVAGTGCASSPDGPAFVTVPHTRYDAAFDAACQATREAGLVPMLVDREAGVIETAPRFAGSVIEPWTWGEMTASDVVEGTLGFERRLARVEFIPVGVAPAAPEGTAPLAGPVLPGSERGVGADMTKVAGDVEIRVTASMYVTCITSSGSSDERRWCEILGSIRARTTGPSASSSRTSERESPASARSSRASCSALLAI
jgi:hypothetical protein